MSTNEDPQKPQDYIKEIVEQLHPLDPQKEKKRDALLSMVNSLDGRGVLASKFSKTVRYQRTTWHLLGWGEQDYINHWWIAQNIPGIIKSACGIVSVRLWVQWVEHYPKLKRCEVCQGFEIKHLNAAQKKLARDISKQERGIK